jgi:glycosyltransferase involved in cell wall biosynthesis
MSQETFSIITPSFQQLDWLRLALASVADQEGVEVEHIIQDAGSVGVEDMFRETGSSSAHPHQPTRLFVEKDGGMYDAVNRGLRRAAGNILAYLNCDEQYLPGTLRVVTDFFARRPDVDVAFGNVVIVDRTGQYICSREVLQPRLYHTWVCTNPVFTAATFFRRRLIDAHRLYFNDHWRDVGDAAWLLELLKRGIRMAPIGQFTTAFADTGENMNLKPNAVLEQRQLGQSAPLWARSLKPVWILQYRLRRLVAGYYFPRPFDYSIYTLEDDKERQTFHAGRPTGIWRNRL